MEQHHSPESEQTFVRNPTPDLTAFQAQINPYLDHICRPLTRTLSAEEVEEQRAEMHAHLEALYAGHRELGYSEAQAVRLAQEQFGRENHLQYAWQNECETAQLSAQRSGFGPAFRFAVRSFGLPFVLAGLFSAWARLTPNLPGSFLSDWTYWYPALLGVEVAVAFMAGFRVGRVVQHRPVLVALAAVLPACLIVPTLCPAIYFLEVFAAYHRIQGIPGLHVYWLDFWLVPAGPVISVMPVTGIAGAACGQLLRRFHRRPVVS